MWPWQRSPKPITRTDTAHVPLGDVLWDEIERLRNVIRSAQATIKEMHPRSLGVTGLSDDLIDLWNILNEGEASNVRATSDR